MALSKMLITIAVVAGATWTVGSSLSGGRDSMALFSDRGFRHVGHLNYHAGTLQFRKIADQSSISQGERMLIILPIRIENFGAEKAIIDQAMISMRDQFGRNYECSTGEKLAAIKIRDIRTIFGKELAAGGSDSGALAFEVPDDLLKTGIRADIRCGKDVQTIINMN